MKRLLSVVLLATLMAAPAAAQLPIKLRVFTAPDDDGVITRESKARQVLLAKVINMIPKKAKGVVVLADDAAVTVEIKSIESKSVGVQTHTSALGIATNNPNLKDTSQLHEISVHAILRFGSFEKELVSVRTQGSSSDDIMFANLVKDFVKDNAAKFR